MISGRTTGTKSKCSGKPRGHRGKGAAEIRGGRHGDGWLHTDPHRRAREAERFKEVRTYPASSSEEDSSISTDLCTGLATPSAKNAWLMAPNLPQFSQSVCQNIRNYTSNGKCYVDRRSADIRRRSRTTHSSANTTRFSLPVTSRASGAAMWLATRLFRISAA
jgi:hypothetical protein